jgi:hypothetical protein
MATPTSRSGKVVASAFSWPCADGSRASSPWRRRCRLHSCLRPCRRSVSSRPIEIRRLDAVRLSGPHAVWKTSLSVCSTRVAGSGRAGMKRTGAGQAGRDRAETPRLAVFSPDRRRVTRFQFSRFLPDWRDFSLTQVHMKRVLIAATLLLASGDVFAKTPYAGMQSRTVKSLSEQQVADLNAGRGMGMAVPVENQIRAYW